VIVATTADVTTFNEYQSTQETGELDTIDLLFPALMTEQPDYQLHPPSFAPRLATSWEFSSNNRTLTFHLRPDARWSDGVPVTADDVRFTFQAQKDARVGSLGMEMKDFIRDVEVVDPHTVRFNFTRVYPYQLMDANDGHIVPAHAWGKVPFEKWHTTDFEKILVTGGPFRLAAHTPQQTIILERDPGYWGSPRPNLDRLVLRVVPDMASQLEQLFAGQLNVVQAVSPQEADRVQANRDLNLVEFPSRMWGMVGWNNRLPMFADRRVRKALSLGINRTWTRYSEVTRPSRRARSSRRRGRTTEPSPSFLMTPFRPRSSSRRRAGETATATVSLIATASLSPSTFCTRPATRCGARWRS
jgi:peptide/nickel transport system substrate-binding protein